VPSTLIRKVDVLWTGLAGGPYYTQFFFGHEPSQATPIAAALRTTLFGFNVRLMSPMIAAIQPEQVVIDTATGKPTATEVAAAQTDVAFGGTGTTLPTVDQVVMRLKTAVFNGGRRLQGRIFLPGIPSGGNNLGRLDSVYKSSFDASFGNLITNTATIGKFAVWSRKNHMWASVESATAWSEFGIMRSRRT
jgi:hypothetical protein